MFARFVHARIITRPISAKKNPANTGLNSRGINRHAGRHAHHGQEFFSTTLMQHIVRQFWSDRRGRGDRDEQLSRIHAKGAIEILRCDSHDGCDLPI